MRGNLHDGKGPALVRLLLVCVCPRWHLERNRWVRGPPRCQGMRPVAVPLSFRCGRASTPTTWRTGHHPPPAPRHEEPRWRIGADLDLSPTSKQRARPRWGMQAAGTTPAGKQPPAPTGRSSARTSL